MSGDGEAEVVAVAAEQPVVEEAPAATEEKQPEETGKEKTSKAPKEKKPKEAKGSHPSHPPYFQMIKDALLALKGRSGSSAYAIAKYVEEEHKGVLPANFKKILWLQLKNFTAKGKLIKIKASFKLADQGNKTGAAKIGAGKPVTRSSKTSNKPENPSEATKAAKPVKKVAARRTRKSTPAKPKQPKSIKSPAAKRAMKATA
ncbi:histone H1-like [Aristolochia californica]|uniref:histone H1-like n=1 Tax=Aristolochia californica TaxID=171875 RepID=UPI0035E16048